MAQASYTFVPRSLAHGHEDDHGGAALFYAMTAAFVGLFTFIMLFGPSHS